MIPTIYLNLRSLPMLLPELVKHKGESLTHCVFHALKTGILALQVKPREYLVIGDIANEYGISRTPVREAIIMLEREGWVKNDSRRGFQVIVPSVKEILEVLEMQAVLEGYIARRAAEKLTDENLVELGSILSQGIQAIEAGDETEGHRLGGQFHRYLAEVVGNHRMRDRIAELEAYIKRIRQLVWSRGMAPASISMQHHREIFEALKDRDPARAEQIMYHHTIWFEYELSADLANI
jgi:DNA-binding GntR family transcriptional regulator